MVNFKFTFPAMNVTVLSKIKLHFMKLESMYESLMSFGNEVVTKSV